MIAVRAFLHCNLNVQAGGFGIVYTGVDKQEAIAILELFGVKDNKDKLKQLEKISFLSSEACKILNSRNRKK